MGGVQEKSQTTVLGKDTNGNDILLSSGRYGPYIKCGKTNYAIPRELREKDITLDDALKIMQTKK